LKDQDVYIEHIIESIERIEEYTSDISEEGFKENELVQDAVIRRIEIIGEAAKRLNDSTRSEYGDIQWRDIAGMRDNLIHRYFGVDLNQVWQTVQKDIPELKNTLGPN